MEEGGDVEEKEEKGAAEKNEGEKDAEEGVTEENPEGEENREELNTSKISDISEGEHFLISQLISPS